MTRADLSVRLAPWLYTVVLFVVWEAAVRAFDVPAFFLPPPSTIAARYLRILARDLPQFAVHSVGHHAGLRPRGRRWDWRSASWLAGRATSTPGFIR